MRDPFVISVPPPLPSDHGEQLRARRLVRAVWLDRDAVIGAGVAVLFLHLLAFTFMPRGVDEPRRGKGPEPEVFTVRLLPEPKEEREAEFLRANPEVEPEKPDADVVDYSNRDQVAAQEEVTPLAEDNKPAQQGDEADSILLVQGDPFRTAPLPAAAAANSPQQQPMASPTPPQMPAPARRPERTPPEVLQADEPDPEGLLAVPKPMDNPEVLEEPQIDDDLQPRDETSRLDGSGNAETLSPPQQSASQPSEVVPRTRPILAKDNTYGPRRDSDLGVSRTGRVSYSARYSEFGEYWVRVQEVIEKQWNLLVGNSLNAITFDGERVVFEIVIRRDGSLGEVRVIQSGVSRFEELLARDAIESRAPFFEWTPDMIATMGEETTFTLGFIY